MAQLNAGSKSEVILTCFSRIIKDYHHLARDFQEIGEYEMSEIFSLLKKNTEKIRDDFTISIPDLICKKGTLDHLRKIPDLLDIGINDIHSPYAAWAFAVSRENSLFNRLTVLASYLSGPAVKDKVIVQANVVMSRIHHYRIQRRLAYHSERTSKDYISFPDIRKIYEVEDFAHIALAIEKRYLQLVRSLKAGNNIENQLTVTTELISELDQITKDQDIPRRLKSQLARLQQNPKALDSRNYINLAKLKIEASRIFDYYDKIFQNSEDEALFTISQKYSGHALKRLQF